ncbi:MAG: hypothetical protein ABSE62_08060 [Chthoniobacteraceae bacterium]|jgi:hypothetical protein
MPRRASSRTHPVWLVVALLLLAGGLAGGAYLWMALSDPYRTLPAIDVAAYLDNGNSLRGNVYKLTGTIDSELAWSPTEGRLFSVIADGGNSDVLPLLIPPEFDSINIQKDQRFSFKIEVGDKGILKASDMRKI